MEGVVDLFSGFDGVVGFFYRRLKRCGWVLTGQVMLVDGCVYDVGGTNAV